MPRQQIHRHQTCVPHTRAAGAVSRNLLETGLRQICEHPGGRGIARRRRTLAQALKEVGVELTDDGGIQYDAHLAAHETTLSRLAHECKPTPK
jgi:hypothetical protein